MPPRRRVNALYSNVKEHVIKNQSILLRKAGPNQCCWYYCEPSCPDQTGCPSEPNNNSCNCRLCGQDDELDCSCGCSGARGHHGHDEHDGHDEHAGHGGHGHGYGRGHGHGPDRYGGGLEYDSHDNDETEDIPLIIQKRNDLGASKGGKKHESCPCAPSQCCCIKPMTCDEYVCWLERYKNLRRNRYRLLNNGYVMGLNRAFPNYFPQCFDHDYKRREDCLRSFIPPCGMAPCCGMPPCCS